MGTSDLATIAPRGVTFSEPLFAAILARLRTGEGLRQVCRDEGMPDPSSVLEWLGRDPSLAQHYAQARESGYSLVGEDLIDIADDSRNDWMDRETSSGRVERVVDRECIERTRLRLDTRKWMLAKMLPKIYGDRVSMDVTVAAFIMPFGGMAGRVAGE